MPPPTGMQLSLICYQFRLAPLLWSKSSLVVKFPSAFYFYTQSFANTPLSKGLQGVESPHAELNLAAKADSSTPVTIAHHKRWQLHSAPFRRDEQAGEDSNRAYTFLWALYFLKCIVTLTLLHLVVRVVSLSTDRLHVLCKVLVIGSLTRRLHQRLAVYPTTS